MPDFNPSDLDEDQDDLDAAIAIIKAKAGRPLTEEEVIAELENGDWDLVTVP